jgi:hypothetical protein
MKVLGQVYDGKPPFRILELPAVPHTEAAVCPEG